MKHATEHVHEWWVDKFPTEARCVADISEEYGQPCPARLNTKQMEAMLNEHEPLKAVARVADTMLRHGNSPKWKKEGLVPWREIAEGINPGDLVALAEAIEALEGVL